MLGRYGAYLYGLFHDSVFPVMLRNFDRYSMMNGVEVRMPFADHRLVSYLFSLPWDAKLRNGYTKAILREAMQGRLRDETRLKREKIGFSAPMVQWMQGPWREFLLDFSSSKGFLESDLGDGPAASAELQALLKAPNATYFDGMRVWGKMAGFIWEWCHGQWRVTNGQ
jgi:asparagine synthase (glutamine-hydrolysing)